MKKGNLLNIFGIAATVIGMGATLLTNYVDKRSMDDRIEEKVNEALTKRDEES